MHDLGLHGRGARKNRQQTKKNPRVGSSSNAVHSWPLLPRTCCWHLPVHACVQSTLSAPRPQFSTQHTWATARKLRSVETHCCLGKKCSASLTSSRNRRSLRGRSGSRANGSRNLPNLHDRNGSRGGPDPKGRGPNRDGNRRRPTTTKATAPSRSARSRARAPSSHRRRSPWSSRSRPQYRKRNSQCRGRKSTRTASQAPPALATKRSMPGCGSTTPRPWPSDSWGPSPHFRFACNRNPRFGCNRNRCALCSASRRLGHATAVLQRRRRSRATVRLVPQHRTPSPTLRQKREPSRSKAYLPTTGWSWPNELG